MSFKEYLIESDYVTDEQFEKLEKYLDQMFATLGLDIVFTNHFKDRVNDTRNRSPITAGELFQLFKTEYDKHGKEIRDLKPDTEAVMRQKARDLNLPFALGYDRYGTRKLQLRPMTVMRKKDFKTHSKVFDV